MNKDNGDGKSNSSDNIRAVMVTGWDGTANCSRAVAETLVLTGVHDSTRGADDNDGPQLSSAAPNYPKYISYEAPSRDLAT